MQKKGQKDFSLDDSRLNARQYIKRVRWPFTKNLTMLLLISVLSFVFVYYTLPVDIDPSIRHAMYILIVAALLWITEAIPPFAVSFLIIGLCVFFLESAQPLDITGNWEKYVNTWSSPVIWILLGGFMLAIGAQITQFDKKFSHFVIRYFGNEPYRLILGIMLTTGILSMFISNTATTAMMLTIIAPFARRYGKEEPVVKAMMLGIATAATLGGMGTVIGTSPNAIALGILQSAGYEFTFVDWMIRGVPLALGLILGSWFILKLVFRTELRYLDISADDVDLSSDFPDRSTTENRIIVVLTFIITIGLWMTSSIHHLPVAVVSLIPIVVFTASGIIRSQEIRLIPWDTLILVAGGLTLGIAITDSGLATYLIGLIPSFGHTLILIVFMGFVTSIISNIMSNTAAASILIPFGALLVPPEFTFLIVLTLALASSTALFLPISTPPNALVFSSGYVTQKDFRIMGSVLSIAGTPLIVITLLLLL